MSKPPPHPLPVIDCEDLPDHLSMDFVYRVTPRDAFTQYYLERTDRNIGWITRKEQDLLHRSVIGIAGCGGMGGLLANIFLRLGVGEVRIADCEVFDESNINRQYAARRGTIGKSKALETARMVRAVSDDAALVVFPQGITEATADQFVDNCDVVCDEVEFWSLGSRLLLHRSARDAGVTVFNCNTVGFGTRLFRFDPKGYKAEDIVGLSYAEARLLQNAVQSRQASKLEAGELMKRMIRGFVPELPEYCPGDPGHSTVESALDRLITEGRAAIIATNPPMAAGFLADHVLLYLLRNSGIERATVTPPPAPGYLYFDALFMQAKSVNRETVTHDEAESGSY